MVACGAWEAWLVRASSARPTDGSAEAFGVSEELTGELSTPPTLQEASVSPEFGLHYN